MATFSIARTTKLNFNNKNTIYSFQLVGAMSEKQ